MPTTFINKDTAILLNEVRGIVLSKNPKLKGTDDNIIKMVLNGYKRGA
jgi:hypothetical protein